MYYKGTPMQAGLLYKFCKQTDIYLGYYLYVEIDTVAEVSLVREIKQGFKIQIPVSYL